MYLRFRIFFPAVDPAISDIRLEKGRANHGGLARIHWDGTRETSI